MSETRRKYRQDPAIKCFIPQCKNTVLLNPNKHFFFIPIATRSNWCNAVNRRTAKGPLYICEDHLNLKEDLSNYQSWQNKNVRGRLKPDVPEKLKIEFSTNLNELDKPCTAPQKDTSVQKNTSIAVQVKPTMISSSTSTVKQRSQHHQQPPAIEEIGSDEQVSATGSTTEFMLSESEEANSNDKHVSEGRNFMINLIVKKPMQYIGLPKKFYWLIDFWHKQCNLPALHIILTLYKLKNNDTFTRISDLFQISLASIWRSFYKVLKILSSFFSAFVYWPPRIDIKRNLPTTFRTNPEYANVQSIIDCFEIEIEKPKDPIQQSLTWSEYKHCNTIKYLISATPDGLINFVSKGYGGRISDVNLVEQSGFLEIIPENCNILADRGFKHLESLLIKKSCKVLRPPSVSKDFKMSRAEVIKSKVIASLRVHIERVIRRVRLYRLLKPHSVVNSKLISSLDKAVVIACGLINLQPPILRNC